MAKRSKKQPPSNPSDIAARRLARREFEDRGLVVNVDPRTEEILSVMRTDCLTLLLRNDPDKGIDRSNERGAMIWLEELIRTASGENGGERRPDYIRGSVEGAPGQNVTQAMIDADLFLVTATEALPPHVVRMLFGLLKPDESHRWREIVQRCTGETNPQAQGAAVRAACAQLVWVQQNINRLVEVRLARRVAA